MADVKPPLKRYHVRLRYLVEETHVVFARTARLARRLVADRASGEAQSEEIVPGSTEPPARWRVERAEKAHRP